MEIGITKQVPVNVKTIKLHMKVCDQFQCSVCDEQGAELKDYEGYVPGFFPGEHYGDYLILDIDIDTGQIVNWKTPKRETIEAFINGDSDE